MIPRNISQEFMTLLTEYPVITLLGPRQSGKTTLVKHLLPGYKYVNLETPELRALANEDPKSFLQQYGENTIFDEIQRVPELISYIQVWVDAHKGVGQFILTGSHQLSLHAAISQSLAGRTSVLHLYPLSIDELSQADIQFDQAESYIYQGFLPRIYDQKQRPSQAYSSYYQTYIEKDVRQLINLKDVSLFERFMKLLAGRAGQLMNYTGLANDVGTSQATIKEWLSILEASFIIIRLPPYFKNFGKRVMKSPKFYFVDTGLLAFLLNISSEDQVSRDPLVGALFENLVILECLKYQANLGLKPSLYFFRDSNGLEVDLIIEKSSALSAIEIKFARTFNSALIANLKKFMQADDQSVTGHLIYNGQDFQVSDAIKASTFNQVAWQHLL